MILEMPSGSVNGTVSPRPHEVESADTTSTSGSLPAGTVRSESADTDRPTSRSPRQRDHLTESEIDRLMAIARREWAQGRHGSPSSVPAWIAFKRTRRTGVGPV